MKGPDSEEVNLRKHTKGPKAGDAAMCTMLWGPESILTRRTILTKALKAKCHYWINFFERRDWRKGNLLLGGVAGIPEDLSKGGCGTETVGNLSEKY